MGIGGIIHTQNILRVAIMNESGENLNKGTDGVGSADGRVFEHGAVTKMLARV